MRFRLGLVAGFASGYYLGARAGREHYEKINDFARRVKRSETFEAATDKAKDVVDQGVEKTKDIVDSKVSDNNEVPDGAVVAPPPDDPFLRTTPEV